MAVILSRIGDGFVLKFDVVESFRHTVSRFSEAMPLPGGEEDGNPESGAMIFDMGGVRIEYEFSFVETFSTVDELYNRYMEIDNFFSTIQMMSGLELEVEENGWVKSNGTSRQVVLKSFTIVRKGGEVLYLSGRVSLYGGTLV